MVSLTSISKKIIGGHGSACHVLRAPEIEKGVGCDLDSYLLVPDSTLDGCIAAARAKLGKDVVILGHSLERDDAPYYPHHLLGELENLAADKIVNQISVDERTRKYAKLAQERVLALR